MKKHIQTICFLLLFVCNHIIGQENPTLRIAKEVKNNTICLRWAVDSPVAWQKSNAIGFQLERFTIMRNGKFLPQAEITDLGHFFVPKMEEWKPWVEKNDNAAIIAQAIYGETFQTEITSGENPIEGIVNKAKEIEQRFSFALMAADLDFEVAQFAGWGYVDTKIQPNESYFYRIKLLPNEKLSVIEAGIEASLQEKDELPAPLEFLAFFQDQKVLLSWDFSTLKNLYGYYFLEKAEENGDFKSVSELPVVNMNPNPEATAMIYVDSLSQNDKTFSYRLRGKTIFGSYSPYTKILSGKGTKQLGIAAQLTQTQALEGEKYRILWAFPKENESEATHFALLHAPDDKNYTIVIDNIAISERNAVHLPPTPSNYYKIRTFGKDGTSQDSFAMLVQPDDDIPPSTIQGLEATIDSLGIVRLRWKPNTDDTMGYYVFRMNKNESEMMRITDSHITETQFSDTISIKNLNKKVFYGVSAIDFRKNESEKEIIELEKPDKIPPSAPIFTEYTEEKNHWKLNWRKSYDYDVVQYHIYRKEKENGQWEKIHSQKHTNNETYSFKETAELTGVYVYSLQAEDRNGNRSEFSPVIHIRHQASRDNRVLRGLNGRVNQGKIQLRWEPIKPEISEIIIYKTIKGEKPTLWRSFSNKITSVDDEDIAGDTTYQYFIKVILEDHTPTPTEKVEVTYFLNI
ncbi:fibronectin type III domain-containing protein [Capnocytophaga sp.]|uniref:fibronectin type III domain-containing protein n=1 Tax=Capnocytophaga sp. TaxID=44737 RepID=UPI0026DC70CE|nr:fibronectin type III domain-containing protein [Capnocytophaga sp.]MDO5105790.1 fibronectin type III domain-containing protein [Capnocytophaga sp.]